MTDGLVTGGCGFIGQHLVPALAAEGQHVTLMDLAPWAGAAELPPGVDLVSADATDPVALHRGMQGKGWCLHFAPTGQAGLSAVLQAARQTGTRVIYASGADVYRRCSLMTLPEHRACTERSGEAAAHEAFADHGQPSLALRLFHVYGPRRQPREVVSRFIHRLSQGEPIQIEGDGSQIRDFIHIRDTVAFIQAALKATPHQAEAVNVCTGRATSILALAQALGRQMGVLPQITFRQPRAGDPRRLLGCPRHAASLLGIRASLDLSSGLRQTLNAVGIPLATLPRRRAPARPRQVSAA